MGRVYLRLGVLEFGELSSRSQLDFAAPQHWFRIDKRTYGNWKCKYDALLKKFRPTLHGGSSSKLVVVAFMLSSFSLYGFASNK